MIFKITFKIKINMQVFPLKVFIKRVKTIHYLSFTPTRTQNSFFMIGSGQESLLQSKIGAKGNLILSIFD